MLSVQQTTTANDLARALEGDEGTFLCRQGVQNFLVVAASGHSIKSGPTPIGPPVTGVIQASAGAVEPWYIAKISNADTSEQQQARR